MSDERKLIDHETIRNIPFLMGMVTKLVHNDMTLLEKYFFFQAKIMAGFVHFSNFFLLTDLDK